MSFQAILLFLPVCAYFNTINLLQARVGSFLIAALTFLYYSSVLAEHDGRYSILLFQTCTVIIIAALPTNLQQSVIYTNKGNKREINPINWLINNPRGRNNGLMTDS